MTKIQKMKPRDKIIDKLIDDKNRLYMRKKQLERELTAIKNEIKYMKIRNKTLIDRNRELLNEIFDNKIKKK